MVLNWFLRSWLRHKWFVLVAGLRIGAPILRLLLHDLSKLHPVELPWYSSTSHYDKVDQRAFNHHVHRNPHHWEYWMMWDSVLPMPTSYVLEMVADWLGVQKARYGHWDIEPWFEQNVHHMCLHLLTKARLSAALERVRRMRW